jgi:hypothetical protein
MYEYIHIKFLEYANLPRQRDLGCLCLKAEWVIGKWEETD